MNLIFTETTPQFLTETIFTQYGKFTGTSSALQISNSFVIAERQVQEEIGAYLSPKAVQNEEVTSFFLDEKIYLGAGEVISIESVTFEGRKRENGEVFYTSGYGVIADKHFGTVRLNVSPYDVSAYKSNCLGSCSNVDPNSSFGLYKANVSYTAGFPTGTHTNPLVSHALVEAADLVLKTIRDEGELADEAHQFIKNYSVGRYSQSVVSSFVLLTRFGLSGKAQYISNLLNTMKIRRSRALGR